MTTICGEELSEADEGIIYACSIETKPRKDVNDPTEYKYKNASINGILTEILERMKFGITTTDAFRHLDARTKVLMDGYRQGRNNGTKLAQEMDKKYGKHLALYRAQGSELYEKYVEHHPEHRRKQTVALKDIEAIYGQGISEADEGVIFACSIEIERSKESNARVVYKYDSSDIKNIIAEIFEPKKPGITTSVAFQAYRVRNLVQSFRQTTAFAQGMKRKHGEQMLQYQAQGSELYERYCKRAVKYGGYEVNYRGYEDDKEDQSIEPVSQSLRSMALSARVEPQGLRSNTQGGSTPSPAGSLVRQRTNPGIPGPPLLSLHDPSNASRYTRPNPLPQLPPLGYPDTSISSAPQRIAPQPPVGFKAAEFATNPRSSLYLQPRYSGAPSLGVRHGDTQRQDRDAISKEQWNHRVQQSAYAPLPIPGLSPTPAPALHKIGNSVFDAMKNYLGPKELNSCSSEIWLGHNNQNYGARGARSPSPHAIRNYEAWVKGAQAEQREHWPRWVSPPREASAPPPPPPQRRRMPDDKSPAKAGEGQRYVFTGHEKRRRQHGNSGGGYNEDDDEETARREERRKSGGRR